MNRAILGAAVALAATASAGQAAVIVNFTPGATTVPTGLTVFQNFDSVAAGTTLGTNASVVSASSSLGSRPAYGSTGNFASVIAGGTASFTFAAVPTFGFTLGSLDTYNTLVLSFADGTTQSFSGARIVNGLAADGDQVATDVNGFVTYTSTGSKLTGATFSSSNTAFEFDNLASGAVPEPATWAMMVIGFGALGGVMRRRTAVRTAFNAA